MGRHWQLFAVIAAGGLLAGGVIFLARPHKPPEVPAPEEPTVPPGNPAFARPPFLDDSGFMLMPQFLPPIADPLSLENARASFHRVGYRGAQALQQRLARGLPRPEDRLDVQVQIALCHLYEGDFLKASELLAQARAAAEADPPRFQKGLPTLIFLQGVAGLRRAETENCVECTCDASCIFPIQPQAVHQKPEGARQAVLHFTEYLQRYPDDDGVRWLLNIAHMTLGEYPSGVPERFRIPLGPFQSEFDIGRFTDVAPKLGVDRLNISGGAIMDDFDNDGLLDLVATSSDEGAPMAFFRNKGDGTFEERTKAAGLEKQLGGLYCVQTDYNNDGWLDIYVARGAWKPPQRPSLLRNNGDGTFTDVTAAAGLAVAVPSQAAAWADYDNDGWLDLFVGAEMSRVDGQVTPTRSFLYRNKGDGTFEEVALKAGVACAGMTCKGANWGDFDNDGYPDLFASNLNGPCKLFRNNGDGTFADVAEQLGVTKPTTAFSCWFWDYDNDGWLDLYVASFDRTLNDVVRSMLGQPFQVQSSRLYRNLGNPQSAIRNPQSAIRFEDVTAKAGLHHAIPIMGSNFADFDNDGWLDFYLGTGDPTYSMLVPNRMFKNVAGRRFSDISVSSGTAHLQKGHGIACGDWDRDGHVDLFVQLGGAVPGDRFRNVLFQNPGHDHHGITLKLTGRRTNRAALGARITLTLAGAPPRTIHRHVTSGSSFGANPLEQTIGLGKADRIERLEVYWPATRTTQVFQDVAADQVIAVTEFEPGYRRLALRKVPRSR